MGHLQPALALLFWVLTLAVLFTTLAPLSHSTRWWVRGWEFPRVHIAIVAVLAIAIGVILRTPESLAASVILAFCVIYQLLWVYPYTVLVRKEIALSQEAAPDMQVSMIAANVLMENKDHHRLRTLIDREDPDVLLLMETDDVWEAELAAQLDRYQTVLRHPLSNHYGMIFATRLPADEARIVYLTEDDTPTLLARLRAPTGAFYFVGLHPRPPVPGTDTQARDEQIRRAAQLADRTVLPVVAMGDFNDVAWSWSARRFKVHGAFRDPRVGRGILPSFDARSKLLRFPIDQLYLTDGLDLISFGRLDNVGSDHFPMKAVILPTPR